jgi:hypothetical protein
VKVRRLRLLASVALLAVPLSGCVFAVGHGESEALRDRVRDLEKRVERLEGGGGQVIMIPGEGAFLERGGMPGSRIEVFDGRTRVTREVEVEKEGER